MNVRIEGETHLVHCHYCHDWKRLKTDTYLHGEEIRCLKCDADDKKGALLGYTHDLPEIFHNDKDN